MYVDSKFSLNGDKIVKLLEYLDVVAKRLIPRVTPTKIGVRTFYRKVTFVAGTGVFVVDDLWIRKRDLP